MDDDKRKILVVAEGAKRDAALMEKLLSVYNIDAKYQIVSYSTNIYTLYKEMFKDNDPESIDLLQLLKSHETDSMKKILFDDTYTDVLLIFDLDPQDQGFTAENIKRMTDYFVESTNMGKLYINYPMVEAYYHMKSIPDPDYDSYYASLDELIAGGYKKRVGQENRDHDYRKFAATKEECNTVIKQNINKANKLIRNNSENSFLPEQNKILDAQLELIHKSRKVAVLSTCSFFVPEYNSKLIH